MPASRVSSPPSRISKIKKEKEKVFDRSGVLLSDADIEEFREIFNLIDTDGSGSIGTDELKQLVESVGMKLTEEQFEGMVNDLDSDGSGEVDFGEFLTTMSQGANAKFSADEIRFAFQTFSRNAPPGLIRIRDLYESLTVYNKHSEASHHEVNELLKHFEESITTLPGVLDKDGMPVRFFRYNDYINLMNTGI